jgi:hypothetical protein
MMDWVGRWDAAVEFAGWVSWKLAILAVGGLLAALLVRFIQKKPCWAWGHDWKYLAVSLRTYEQSGGLCGEEGHRIHVDHQLRVEKCWVSVASCRKCPATQRICQGAYNSGAWTIENERLVVDEKALANWEPQDTIWKEKHGGEVKAK